MPFRQHAAASQQILDFGTKAAAPTTIATHTYSGDFTSGTLWPLLPNQTVRIFNASGDVFADAAGFVVLQAISLYVQLYDAAGNALATSVIGLAAVNYGQTVAQGALINGTETGAQIAVSGDPLIELTSNFLLAGTSVSGAGAAQFGISCAWDAYNTDASSHTVYAAVHMLFSRTPRLQ